MTLPEKWESIRGESAPRRGIFRVLPATTSTHNGPVLYALDAEDRLHLLLPLAADARFTPDQLSAGVQLLPRDLEDEQGSARFADLVCLKPHLVELFSHICDDVLASIASTTAGPVTAAKRVLNRWRELLERDRLGLLNVDELSGLFGELWILKQLAERSPSVIGSWTGPSGSRFDFQRGLTAVEVKTIGSPDRLVVQIHGVDQLEPPVGGELYVVVVSVDRTNAAGDSVPSLIAHIRQLGIDAMELSSRLHAAGYEEHYEARYAEVRFAVLAERWFPVLEDFPRIRRSSFVWGDLPAGVFGLRYAVDLTTPPPSPLAAGTVPGILARLTSE